MAYITLHNTIHHNNSPIYSSNSTININILQFVVQYSILQSSSNRLVKYKVFEFYYSASQ